MHKRVCGERSNPFQWPGLRPEEVKDMLEISQLPSDSDGRLTTWLDGFSAAKNLPSTLEVRKRFFEASSSKRGSGNEK